MSFLRAAFAATACAMATNAMPAAPYDPLAVPAGAHAATLELSVASDKRAVPLLVYLPDSTKPAPVVLFSHGLGGSRQGNAYMGEHWAARGYVTVFPQHVGSDTSVWKDKSPAEAMRAMRTAANAQNFTLRVEDIHRTLDALERWNDDPASPLHGRLDLAHIGMSGHSFGAVTTQAVSGQAFPLGSAVRDRRISAAIMYSPSPARGAGGANAFAGVDIPWLLMTGTEDSSPIGNMTAASRLEVFQALPPGRKYELVLDHAEHSAFTDRALPGEREARNPNHHRAILAISTAFWDGYLKNDAAARAWLDGAGPRSVLEAADRWEKK